MTKTLSDISEDMKQIDFCTLSTHAPGGTIGARPNSSNTVGAAEHVQAKTCDTPAANIKRNARPDNNKTFINYLREKQCSK